LDKLEVDNAFIAKNPKIKLNKTQTKEVVALMD